MVQSPSTGRALSGRPRRESHVRGEPCGGGIRDHAVTGKGSSSSRRYVCSVSPSTYEKHTPESPLNLQFVIDAFASKDSIKEKRRNIDLRFNSIMIRRGNFSYNVDSEKETPGKFNASISYQEPECQDIPQGYLTRTA